MSAPATTIGPRLAVYSIVERDGDRAHWLRIGAAFKNRDGSININLDALPNNGKLHVREIEPGKLPPTPVHTPGGGNVSVSRSWVDAAERNLAEQRALLQRLVDLVDSGEFRDGLPLRAIARDAAELLVKGGGR